MKYVEKIQEALKTAGYYTGTVDGIAGELTLNAVTEALETASQKSPTQDQKGEFSLSQKSLSRLVGVNPRLVSVVKLAIKKTSQDFTVLEGLRSEAKQAVMVRKGASQTMKSNHLTGKAVDLAPIVNGAISWDIKYYYAIAQAMRDSAEELGITIKWGGAWEVLNGCAVNPEKMVSAYTNKRRQQGKKAFIDAPHFELV